MSVLNLNPAPLTCWSAIHELTVFLFSRYKRQWKDKGEHQPSRESRPISVVWATTDGCNHSAGTTTILGMERMRAKLEGNGQSQAWESFKKFDFPQNILWFHDFFDFIYMYTYITIWLSGKLLFECQKNAKKLTFFPKKLLKFLIFFKKITIGSFFEKSEHFWQFF